MIIGFEDGNFYVVNLQEFLLLVVKIKKDYLRQTLKQLYLESITYTANITFIKS